MLSSPSSPIILRTDESGIITLKKKFKTKLLFRSRQSIGKKSEHSLCVKRTQKAIFRIETGNENFMAKKWQDIVDDETEAKHVRKFLIEPARATIVGEKEENQR